MMSFPLPAHIYITWAFIVCGRFVGFVRGCVLDQCDRQDFMEMSGQSPLGGTVIDQRGPLPWKRCRRLCRQHYECLTFKVTWTGGEGFGMCTIYHGFIRHRNLTAEATSTTFLSCPAQLVWDLQRDTCRSRALESRRHFFDAAAWCDNMFKYSLPGEPRVAVFASRNDDDQAFLRTFAAGTNVWMGLYRPLGGGVNDFVYTTDGAPVMYTIFHAGRGEPNGDDVEIAYVAAFQKFAHEWFDREDALLYFLCEI